jgi:hypothetical protein
MKAKSAHKILCPRTFGYASSPLSMLDREQLCAHSQAGDCLARGIWRRFFWRSASNDPPNLTRKHQMRTAF